MRSGARTLTLLAAPPSAPLLRGLAGGPRPLTELQPAISLPQTTLRGQLKRLCQLEAVNKRRRNRFPGALEYELTESGIELLSVVDELERWLAASAEPPRLGGAAARAAIKALTEGWSTSILRVIAAHPHSLTALDRLIGTLNYPSIERRLATMRLAGLVAPCPEGGRGTPYEVTAWSRLAVTPVAAAMRWERRHLPDAALPPGKADIETALLLALPLLRLPPALSGSCRLVAELAGGNQPRLAGAMIQVDAGRIASVSTRLEGSPDGWILGSPTAWLDAFAVGEPGQFELGGECKLGRSVLDALARIGERQGTPKMPTP